MQQSEFAATNSDGDIRIIVHTTFSCCKPGISMCIVRGYIEVFYFFARTNTFDAFHIVIIERKRKNFNVSLKMV